MTAPRLSPRGALLVGLSALIFGPVELSALPHMSLTAGSPCSTCHVSPQGGAARNEIGWGNEHFMGMVGWRKLGLERFEEAEDASLAGGKLLLGADVRLQIARLGRPTPKAGADAKDAIFEGNVPADPPEIRAIPMQMQPYLTVLATPWLTLTGSYNVGYHKSRYPGMTPLDASVIVHPGRGKPVLRAGLIQPSIGIRHDDHTMLLRADAAAPRTPIIPPNYNEPGAEVQWQPVSWLRAEAGAFMTRNLHDVMPDAVDSTGPGWLGRVTWLPQVLDLHLNGWLGASLFGAGDFKMLNVFAGVGKDKRVALQVEASKSWTGEGRETTNGMAMLTVPLQSWIAIEARVERANTVADGHTHTTDALVLGTQFFPIGYLELRPEYRLIKTDEYALGQYTLQMHAFF